MFFQKHWLGFRKKKYWTLLFMFKSLVEFSNKWFKIFIWSEVCSIIKEHELLPPSIFGLVFCKKQISIIYISQSSKYAFVLNIYRNIICVTLKILHCSFWMKRHHNECIIVNCLQTCLILFDSKLHSHKCCCFSHYIAILASGSSKCNSGFNWNPLTI